MDADERPDLVERLRGGSLHAIACPKCGAGVGEADAPLLILRRAADPPLVFSPAQRTTPQEDQAHANGLVGLLRERLGPEWRDAWVANGLAGTDRALVPVVLSDDPKGSST